MSIFDLFKITMSIFDLFKRKKSSEVAKKRLMMVLSYERQGLPPNFAEQIYFRRILFRFFQSIPSLIQRVLRLSLKMMVKLISSG